MSTHTDMGRFFQEERVRPFLVKSVDDSQCAGLSVKGRFGTFLRNKWCDLESLKDMRAISQTLATAGIMADGALKMLDDGLGKVGQEGFDNAALNVFLTGAGNTLKNASYFPLKYMFNKKSSAEPLVDQGNRVVLSDEELAMNKEKAAMKAELGTAGLTIGTNSFAVAGGADSVQKLLQGVAGDPVALAWGASSLLTVIASAVDVSAISAKLLRKPANDSGGLGVSDMDKAKFSNVHVDDSKTVGVLSRVAKKGKDLVCNFAKQVGDKAPGALHGTRAIGTLALGVSLGEPFMAATGAGLLVAAVFKYRGDNMKPEIGNDVTVPKVSSERWTFNEHGEQDCFYSGASDEEAEKIEASGLKITTPM